MLKKAWFLLTLFVVLALSLSADAQIVKPTDYVFVFLDFPSEIEMTAGSSLIKDVYVKNIGDYSSLVELTLETTAPISASVVPGSMIIEKGDTGIFSLSLLPSESAAIGKHPSKLQLRGRGVNLEKGFTITITPSPEKKFEINNNYLVLLNRYESLKKRFEQIRDSGCVLVQAGDVTAVAPKQIVDSLQNLNDKVEKIMIAIKENDFVTANVEEEKGDQLANLVEADINSLKSAQDSCEEEKSRVSGYLVGGAVGTTLGIIIIVAVLGLGAYRYYMKMPRVRKLIPSTHPAHKGPSTNLASHPNVKRLDRNFRYEYRKKK